MPANRFEQIMQPLNVGERLAVSAALFMAQDMKEAFIARYGTYGWEHLEKVLSPSNPIVD